MSNIVIDIAAEFSGKKAFKQADSATEKLGKTAKGLAKTFGLAFGTAAILGYAKASVKAAAADQKAQQQLALALNNVGLGRQAASSERYIQGLQSEFGVVDDLLRPAYQQLAIATRDAGESQRLLGLALDISASTGKDLSSVTSALSKAFLGNNTALSKLGVGISKADLKTKSFKKITDELAVTFKGSAKAASDTFAGSIAKLGVASANVKEIIGTGLIDALKMLGKDKSVAELAKNMEATATYLADVIRGFAVLIGQLDRLVPGGFKLDIQMIPIIGSAIAMLNEAGAKAARIAAVTAQKNPIQSGSFLNSNKVAKARLTVDKDSLKLAKAKAIFDLQKIQIEAALKGKISEQDRIRLLLMKAIAAENISDIDKYTKALDAAQAKTKSLQDLLTTMAANKVGNVISTEYYKGLSDAEIALEKFKESGKFRIAGIGSPISPDFYRGLSDAMIALERFKESGGFRLAGVAAGNAVPSFTSGLTTATIVKKAEAATADKGITGTTNVTVNVAGTVTAQEDLEKAIQDAINKSRAAGNVDSLAPRSWRSEVE